jgi:hypothetical protein
MKVDKIPPFNGAERVGKILESYPISHQQALELYKVLQDIFWEKQAIAFNDPPEKWRINSQDKAIFELGQDIRNLEGLFIEFEDYRHHYERIISLLKQLIDRNLSDVNELEGYQNHIEKLEQFYLDIQRNPKYENRFYEFPRG